MCLILVQFSDDDRDGRKISINKFKLLKLYVTFYNVVDKANFDIIFYHNVFTLDINSVSY